MARALEAINLEFEPNNGPNSSCYSLFIPAKKMPYVAQVKVLCMSISIPKTENGRTISV
jgi:hypothetical protein